MSHLARGVLHSRSGLPAELIEAMKFLDVDRAEEVPGLPDPNFAGACYGFVAGEEAGGYAPGSPNQLMEDHLSEIAEALASGANLTEIFRWLPELVRGYATGIAMGSARLAFGAGVAFAQAMAEIDEPFEPVCPSVAELRDHAIRWTNSNGALVEKACRPMRAKA